MKKQLIAIVVSLLVTFGAHGQWTGQSSSTDLVSPISRTGSVMTTNMFNNDGVNGAQIRLNSNGTYYGKIGNPTPQVWSLGWGGSVLDINPVLNWTATGNVGIGTTTPASTTKLEINQSAGGSGQNQGVRIWAGNTNNYFGNSQIQFSYGGGGGGYSHAIKSRHNSGAISGNAIDFYLWQPGDPVNGEGSLNAMTLNGSYMGLGTNAPLSQLHLNSSIERQTFRLYKNGNTTNYLSIWQGVGGAALDPIGTGLLYLGYDQPTTVIMGMNGGKIGIGTGTPDQLLTVKGIIHSQEVRVDLTVPGPDYVFEKDYRLPALKEVKDYIDQNKRLPDVPSAAEMEKNGVQLGEMNMLLLKKMEEMTLYILDQQKQIEALKSRMETIRNKTE